MPRRLPQRSLVLSVGLCVLPVGFLLSRALETDRDSSLALWTAEAARWLLRLSGAEAVQHGALLQHPGGFGYEVTLPCVGLGPMAVVALAVAGARDPWRRRLMGILLGVAVVTFANLARLVGLFWAGVASPSSFSLVHHTLGQGWMIATMAGFLLGWFRDRLREGPRPLPLAEAGE